MTKRGTTGNGPNYSSLKGFSLVLPVDIDTAALGALRPRKDGLPDAFIDRDLNDINIAALLKFLRVSEHDQYAISMEEIIDGMADDVADWSFRLTLLVAFLQGKFIDVYQALPSFEATAFTRVVTDWNRAYDSEVCIEIWNSLPEGFTLTLKSWLNELIESHPTTTSDLLKLEEIEEVKECLLIGAGLVFAKVLVDLKRWANFNAKQRNDLINAVFGAYTVFGPRAVAVAINQQQAVADYFQNICRGENKNFKEFDESAEPKTSEELYEILRVLLRRGSAGFYSLEYAQRILDTLQAHLPRLQAAEQLDASRVESLLRTWIEILERYGRHYKISLFSDDSFLTAFRISWLLHFDDELRQDIPDLYFSGIQIDRHSNACASPSKRLADETRARLADAQAALDEIFSHLEKADFRSRLGLQKDYATALQRSAEAQSNLQAAEAELIRYLLPENVSVETLPETDTVTLHPEAYSDSGNKALRKLMAMQRLDHPVPENDNELEVSLEPMPASSAPQSEDKLPPPPDIVAPTITQVHASEPGPDPHDTWQAPQPVPAIPPAVPVPVAAAPAAAPVEQSADKVEPDAAPAEPSVKDGKQAGEQLLAILAEPGPVPSSLINAAALHWVSLGQTAFACAVLTLAEATERLQGSPLPAAGLRAAYMGSNVWNGDASTLGRIQRELAGLDEAQEQMSRMDPGNRLGSYISFAAAFQSTLFTGMMTPAHRILVDTANHLDPALTSLIEAVTRFASRNETIDFATLAAAPSRDDGTARREVGRRLSALHDRIMVKQTGWAPSFMAMRAALQDPRLKPAIAAIEQDEVKAATTVQAFVTQFSDVDAQAAFMAETVAGQMGEGRGAPEIEGNARSWFLRQLSDMVALGEEWLALVGNKSTDRHGHAEFVSKLLAHTRSAQLAVEHRLAGNLDPEQAAGLRLAHDVLRNVLRAADADSSVVWDHRRADAWFAVPLEWAAVVGGSADPAERLKVLLGYLTATSEDEFTLQFATDALERREVRIATLVALYRKGELGKDMEDLSGRIQTVSLATRRDLRKQSDELLAVLDSAQLARLLDDGRHQQLSAELDYAREALNDTDPLLSLTVLRYSLEGIDRELTALFSQRLVQLRTDLNSALDLARVEFGSDPVPREWLAEINAAMDVRDLTVAIEMLEHLRASVDKREPLPQIVTDPNPLLGKFLACEQNLFNVVSDANARDIVRRLIQTPISGLQFTRLPEHFKPSMAHLLELRKPPAEVDKKLYEAARETIQMAGIDVVETAYNSQVADSSDYLVSGKFCKLTYTARRSETGRGLPFFDPEEEFQSITVVMAFADWTPDELDLFLSDKVKVVHPRTFLLSTQALDNAARNAFAQMTKQKRRTLFHLDVVMLGALAGMEIDRANRLRATLQITVPWTYLNPYRSSETKPAVPEMRYGRRREIEQLTTIPGGAAILTGGRQLGKTTTLNEARRNFHNVTLKRYGFLRQIDFDIPRHNLSPSVSQALADRVWELIYQNAIKATLVKSGLSSTAERQSALMQAFERSGDWTMLQCFDEVDPLLEVDAANGFPVFRGLSALIEASRGKFKVIVAGLQNVNRFADVPNYPLHQLGNAIQVKILDPVDAKELVIEPLALLGFRFESPLLPTRILVETNRHPGLIHMFCHELVNRLQGRRQHVGSVLITSADIDQVRQNPDVIDVFRNRFEITLNLDTRYRVICLGLIAQGAMTFTVARAKAIASEWAGDVFRGLTERQFEAYLSELCDLGIFKVSRSSDGVVQYSLRNPNILNLMGGNTQDIEDKLLAAVQDMSENDPLTAHAFQDGIASPLTLRDEQILVMADPDKKKGSSRYSVAIIAGSTALGIDGEFDKILSPIGEFENMGQGHKSQKYQVSRRSDFSFKTIKNFQTVLVDVIIGKQSMTAPQVVLIDVTGVCEVDEVLNLIDVANAAQERVNVGRGHQVRVVFLMNPKGLLKWHERRDLTRAREAQQPFILLDRWTNRALAHLLNNLELENSSQDIALLREMSQGWFLYLKDLVSVRLRDTHHSRVATLKGYHGIGKLDAAQLEAFLEAAGVKSAPWCRAVLAALPGDRNFDAEDVELELLEIDCPIPADAAIDWLIRLRLLDPVHQSAAGARPSFRVPALIHQALQPQASLKKA